MKVLVAGATGAVGKMLIPLLVRRGHQVVGTTRSANRVHTLRSLGAHPVIMDGLDRDSVLHAVQTAKPDAIVHQMTSLAGNQDLKRLDRNFETTNRLRTQGTTSLLAAARVAGTRRIVVQSFTGWPNARHGGPVKTEDDPLDATPPESMHKTLDAIRELEGTVLTATDLEGIVLRYGAFYGPGTAISVGGDVAELILHRKLPIVGSGAGVWSFIHMTDVAYATALAVEGGPSGLYNIVDDEPAPVSVWLPELARILGAKPPVHVPEWIAQLMIGESGVSMMTRIRGSSNTKAKRDLKWTPIHASWRDGFRAEFGTGSVPQAAGR